MPCDRIDLAGQWKRSVGGRDIDFVSVPGSYPPVGECVLEYEFECPWEPSRQHRLFLVTEGVLASAVFCLNGENVGVAGPWATYRFELPAGLLQRHNGGLRQAASSFRGGNCQATATVAVVQARIRDIVDDFGPTPGRRFDAGLVRRIWIERRPAAFLESMAFRAELTNDLASASCIVAVEINGRAAQQVDVVLAERETGRVVAEAAATAESPAQFTLPWPRLWSPEMPNLYTLTATLRGEQPDALVENVGFRRIEVRGQDFYLNNQRLLLKGVCRHEFTDASGYSPAEDEVRRELALIKHAGFNYIRLVHSPHAPCVCRIAAELGLLVSEEPGTCFHDLGNEAISAPALESLRRTVKRDRNVPSVFAWLIYNECNPSVDYAVRAAKVCRELDPGCRLGMADCSGQHDNVKAMAAAADMTFYGINVYSFWPNDYCERMKVFTDRPLVFTEWGGCLGQGNPRLLKDLCDSFVIHSRQGESLRMAGCSFWAWADYEEHSRPGPATADGWTIEGLVDGAGRPKPDLQTLSMMCFEMDRPPLRLAPRAHVQILCPAPRRDESWEPVPLDGIKTAQEPLEEAIEQMRRNQLRYAGYFIPMDPALPAMPQFGRLMADGIEFRCRDAGGLRQAPSSFRSGNCQATATVAGGPAYPLLLGKGCEEVVIPVGRQVSAIAALGHVAIQGGYPASAIFSVHHRDAEAGKPIGTPAAEYEFLFQGGKIVQPLRHGLEILRSNDICRWWTPAPRAPHTRPAVRVALDKTHEILRLDLWEREFPEAGHLEAIRWRLLDPDAILLLYGLSVRVEP